MIVELEHYIIAVGSHWLGTQPPWPASLPRLTMGLSAPPGSQSSAARFAEGRCGGRTLWSRRSRLYH